MLSAPAPQCPYERTGPKENKHDIRPTHCKQCGGALHRPPDRTREGVQTQSPPEFINNMRALVTIAQIYKLPSIITISAADGPNGPIMPVVAEGLPDATIVHRPGEINA